MPITVVCPGCGAKIRAADSAAGRKAQCPSCKAAIRIPPAQPSSPSAGSAPPKTPPASSPAANAKSSAVKPSGGTPPSKRSTTESSAGISPSPAARQGKPLAKSSNDAKYDELEIVSTGKDRWAGSSVVRKNRLFLKKRWGLTSLVYTDFDLLDPDTKERVGVANESPALWVLILGGLSWGRFCLRSLLPTTLEVREREEGPLLFRLVRQPKITNWLITVSIYDGDGKYLGYFRSKLLSFFGGFYVFNPRDEQIGEASFKWGTPPGLAILDNKKTALGSCYPEGLREALEQKKMTMTFSIGRPALDLKYSDAIRNDPQSKLLFLASILAMEYTGLGKRFLTRT